MFVSEEKSFDFAPARARTLGNGSALKRAQFPYRKPIGLLRHKNLTQKLNLEVSVSYSVLAILQP